ncbi:unnamed protein product [Caenorhabditis brenneri]
MNILSIILFISVPLSQTAIPIRNKANECRFFMSFGDKCSLPDEILTEKAGSILSQVENVWKNRENASEFYQSCVSFRDCLANAEKCSNQESKEVMKVCSSVLYLISDFWYCEEKINKMNNLNCKVDTSCAREVGVKDCDRKWISVFCGKEKWRRYRDSMWTLTNRTMLKCSS